jgi:endo-1,4-beta-xylanase
VVWLILTLFASNSWTTNPLVEYYVMDCNVGISTGGTQKGTVQSDGATYAIWQHQQTNQPSIQGTSTFQQYISIRQGCTSSGTITLANHFNAWASHNMNLGQMNFQVIAVESWSGSGSANQQISNTVSSSPPPPPPPPPPTSPSPPPPATSSAPPPPSTSSGGGGSGCSAIWGQCGGLGWTGPQCCAQGTCHVGNPYYSQCY